MYWVAGFVRMGGGIIVQCFVARSYLAWKLVDEFSVRGGEGDGVIAGVKGGGDVPDEGRPVRDADDSEEEVGACGGGCR